ncbi:hypothetical protein FIBSPDRAFT_931776 [Athelia psychrophila]|uniref:Uncharacterized protein n=1 Tax=Athelia psychrophila TaxID=1759441 RepID=A0A166JRG5_9AGAM|nr:hypothetical protein FIBSPDRAFT_931776 [Fibularhizoctonia sp. CBS 109695]
MRPDSEDRQRLALSLTRRLEDIATGRRNLVLQQENFDRQEKAVQRKFKSLHNMNAAISIFPSEILSMIFEAGALFDSSPRCHFGSLVSHVSRHWRKIALATPRLWNKIECTRSKVEEDECETYMTYSELERERVATFLSRSKSSPVDIRIQDFCKDDPDDIQTRDFLAMLGNHVGQFHHLSIKDGILNTLKYLSHKPASILRSILISLEGDYDVFHLERPLFPFGAPHLTIAQLNNIATSSLHFCLPSFQHLQCLRLQGIEVDRHEFRDALMALPVLNHLELSVDNFSQRATRFPAVLLPTLRFLQVETYHLHTLDCAILAILTIHAASLTTLSLSGWDDCAPELDLSSEEALESHFPALQHLILAIGNTTNTSPDLEVIARRFPEIERLTCQVLPHSGLCYGIDHILTAIDAGSSGDNSLRWPKLHTVAVSGSRTPLDAAALHYKIYVMRDAGHPLRKLKLPESLLALAGTKAMGYLRTIVDVEDFSIDWPTPFEGFA